jgi:hypothetical protein
MRRRPLLLAWLALLALVCTAALSTSCGGRQRSNQVLTPGAPKFWRVR